MDVQVQLHKQPRAARRLRQNRYIPDHVNRVQRRVLTTGMRIGIGNRGLADDFQL
jgi:ribosomal protein L39E